MVKKFTDLQGKASKSGPERFKPQEGTNRIRILNPVIPSYKYWVEGSNNMSVPLDCLSFDRETEKFNNAKPDPVRRYFPEKRCSWAYMSYVIDRADGKIKLFDHKKKLFEAILDAAKKKLGDPTDEETGWDIVFTKEKTGPHAFNVEYKLEIFEIEPSPLSDEDKEKIEKINKAMPIEQVTKLPTPEEQEEFIKNYILSANEDEEDEEAEKELNEDDDLSSDDDIPH